MTDSASSDESPDLLSTKRNAFWLLWKRRALLLFALLLLLVPLYGTFEPLFEFILFAVSLAALTYPVFFRPIERFSYFLLPLLKERRRSELCAVFFHSCPAFFPFYAHFSSALASIRRPNRNAGHDLVPCSRRGGGKGGVARKRFTKGSGDAFDLSAYSN